MKKNAKLFTDTVISMVLVVSVIFSTTLLARQVVNSSIYRQSRIVSMLMQQDHIGVADMLEDARNIDMVISFAGALTKAYINFELIPVNEASTFMVVFESLPPDVTVESFEYRRKDLIITGAADNIESYGSFLDTLKGQEHFFSITGSSYESTGGGLRFEIICVSDNAEAYITL